LIFDPGALNLTIKEINRDNRIKRDKNNFLNPEAIILSILISL